MPGKLSFDLVGKGDKKSRNVVEEKIDELCIRLLKKFVLVILAASFVILLGWICYETLASVFATADEKKWAMSSITAIAGGLTGYLIRR